MSQASECCCRSHLPSRPTYQAFFPHSRATLPSVRHISYFPLHLMSFYSHFVRVFYIKYQLVCFTCHCQPQQLLHCQARTFTHFPDYQVFSVNTSSKKNPVTSMYTILMTFCTHILSYLLFILLIFSSTSGYCLS